ncbi:MAG: bifunctional adenosylcobinamide kinase/adenosylcobinamide-phosphate guanylyltransferase [Ktedonobacterales bacterium]
MASLSSPSSDLQLPNKRLMLILGGARSGKSSYAESLALRLARERLVVYVATAEAGDDEMRARIADHQASRLAAWATIEAPLNPAAAIAGSPAATAAGVVLLDCVTLWVSNVLLSTEQDATAARAAAVRVGSELDALLDLYRAAPWSLVLVTNEVGMGLVPPYPLGRIYRDLLGRVNARLAAEADAVALLVAGLAVELKALATAWEHDIVQRLGLDDL